jgi:hypothetical protein
LKKADIKNKFQGTKELEKAFVILAKRKINLKNLQNANLY